MVISSGSLFLDLVKPHSNQQKAEMERKNERVSMATADMSKPLNLAGYTSE